MRGLDACREGRCGRGLVVRTEHPGGLDVLVVLFLGLVDREGLDIQILVDPFLVPSFLLYSSSSCFLLACLECGVNCGILYLHRSP